jgi:hypothetical protein
MGKTKQPDVTITLFEQAGPDIKKLAAQMRTIENPDVRDTLLHAMWVLLGKPVLPSKIKDQT